MEISMKLNLDKTSVEVDNTCATENNTTSHATASVIFAFYTFF